MTDNCTNCAPEVEKLPDNITEPDTISVPPLQLQDKTEIHVTPMQIIVPVVLLLALAGTLMLTIS